MPASPIFAATLSATQPPIITVVSTIALILGIAVAIIIVGKKYRPSRTFRREDSDSPSATSRNPRSNDSGLANRLPRTRWIRYSVTEALLSKALVFTSLLALQIMSQRKGCLLVVTVEENWRVMARVLP